MRAVFFFLFCLGAASGQALLNNGWTSLENDLGSLPNNNECSYSEQSCSCCVMQRQLTRMETVFNTSIDELDFIMASAKMSVDRMIRSRGAFSVSLNDYEDLRYLGPFDHDVTVVYEHVFLNQGSYDPGTGKFLCGSPGVYNFAVTIRKPPSDHSMACVSLQVNGEDAARLTEYNQQDETDVAMTTLVVHLNEGDVVEVKLKAGCEIGDNKMHLNSFTGFLLYSYMIG